ncbi:MAG: hypothetical protein SWK76_09610 [Actinomycetota bacterium]|nr:hypothetical protein [Actinomycetota bacterium]
MTDFNRKVAAVAGAASGIGRETALAFARRGAVVVPFDIDGEGLAARRGSWNPWEARPITAWLISPFPAG